MDKINYIIKCWKKITPKWDNEELAEYKNYLYSCTKTKINEIYNRQKYLASKKCMLEINAEVEKMCSAGMYDHIKQKNALD